MQPHCCTLFLLLAQANNLLRFEWIVYFFLILTFIFFSPLLDQFQHSKWEKVKIKRQTKRSQKQYQNAWIIKYEFPFFAHANANEHRDYVATISECNGNGKMVRIENSIKFVHSVSACNNLYAKLYIVSMCLSIFPHSECDSFPCFSSNMV